MQDLFLKYLKPCKIVVGHAELRFNMVPELLVQNLAQWRIVKQEPGTRARFFMTGQFGIFPFYVCVYLYTMLKEYLTRQNQ